MQNNLLEYYTMVSFVKPNFLGTINEFNNQFANPITNGQYTDSTEEDVKLMKKRFFVLHRSLEHTTIHRKGNDILESDLPPRYEYVFNLKLTPSQIALYRHYLKWFVFGNLPFCDEPLRALFVNFNILGYIWNHPALLLHYFHEVKQRTYVKKIKEKIMDFKFLDVAKKGSLELVSKIIDNWSPENLPKEEEILEPHFSAKFDFLFSMLEECERCGDKMIVFSQCLLTLDLIEKFLQMKTRKYGHSSIHQISYEELKKKFPVTNRWFKNMDYFRIDGTVSCEERGKIIERINGKHFLESRLLLISTKAGGIISVEYI